MIIVVTIYNATKDNRHRAAAWPVATRERFFCLYLSLFGLVMILFYVSLFLFVYVFSFCGDARIIWLAHFQTCLKDRCSKTGCYAKVVVVEVVIVELGQSQLPISQKQLKYQSKRALWLQPPRLRPPVRGTERPSRAPFEREFKAPESGSIFPGSKSDLWILIIIVRVV